jgi:hypothetical protein
MSILTSTSPDMWVLAQDSDIIGWLGTKTGELGALFRSVSVVAGIGFVILQAIKSGGAIARIVISGIAAGIFVWIVFNVTDLRDRVDSEVNAAAPVSAAPSAQPPPGPVSGVA